MRDCFALEWGDDEAGRKCKAPPHFTAPPRPRNPHWQESAAGCDDVNTGGQGYIHGNRAFSAILYNHENIERKIAPFSFSLNMAAMA